MSIINRNNNGFITGTLIGSLGGLIGLGGAEFRLPVLVKVFKINTLEAIIFNKAMSLVVVAASLIFRLKTISVSQLLYYYEIPLNLLAGSLVGAWFTAGYAIKMDRKLLNIVVMVLLSILSVIMLGESFLGINSNNNPLFHNIFIQLPVGVISGFIIGVFAALLGVAGGELLIPTIVLLYGIDIKIAGSLSLIVSFPTMLVGFARYTESSSFKILKEEKSLFKWMVAGSISGSAIGGLFIGYIPTNVLLIVLSIILLISAVKIFKNLNK